MRAPLLAVTLLAALPFAFACSGRDDASEPAVPGSSTAAASAAQTAASTATVAKPATASATADTSTTFNAANALTHINHLAETIGVRVSGTDAENRTVEYLAGRFRELGFDVTTPSFEYEESAFRTAEVAIGGTKLPALTMVGSRSGTVKGAAVAVGLADTAGIAGKDLTGKVAIADRGTLTFAQKVDAVRQAGAIALIVVNNEPGDLSGQLAGETDLAVAGIARESGDALRAAAASGAVVSVTTTGRETKTGMNVVAKPKGSGACAIVVGGHHDTVPGAPGAHDNASGTATVVELARAMAADGFDAGICFVTFGAEESGLFGSKDFVADLEAAGAPMPKFMINLDQMGEGSRVDLIGTVSLVRQAAAIAERLGIPAQATTLGTQYGSDHQSFQNKGVPVLFFTSNEFGKFHTPGDTADRIQQDEVQRVGDVALEVLKELARQVGAG
ncbi:MAG: M20/M25/M40 family metallo-hydrolase [Dehalococcoidia bacterium]